MSSCEYQIIDCHFHPVLDIDDECNWFHSSGDIINQIDTLRRAGISHACGSPIRLHKPDSFDQIQTLNDKALRLRDLFSEFYIPGIHIHPHFPEESCMEIERCCLGEGVRWIGELVGYIMGYKNYYATKNALCIMREAAKHKVVVNIHCNNLNVVGKLCREAPNLKIVLAHLGKSKEEILNRLETVRCFPNLYLDISGSGIDRYGVLRKAVDVVGKNKIIFGTDYPINNPDIYVKAVHFEPLSEDERSAIFKDNMLTLIQ